MTTEPIDFSEILSIQASEVYQLSHDERARILAFVREQVGDERFAGMDEAHVLSTTLQSLRSFRETASDSPVRRLIRKRGLQVLPWACLSAFALWATFTAAPLTTRIEYWILALLGVGLLLPRRLDGWVVFPLVVLIAARLLPSVRDASDWGVASTGDTAKDYAVYLNTWPDGRSESEARARYDGRGWEAAIASDTIDSYRHYEQDHPTGSHLAEAKRRIEEISWQQALKEASAESLQAYVDQFPKGQFVAEARSRQKALADDADWGTASSADRAQDYWDYLTRWPTGSHVNEAQLRYDERGWSVAVAANTIDGYRQYQNDHPNGSHIADALVRIEDAAWQQAVIAGTVQALHVYVGSFPDGRFLGEAKSRQEVLNSDDTRYQVAIRKSTVVALEEFLLQFPGHARSDDARGVIKDLSEGGDMVDLLGAKKIEVEVCGSSITTVYVRVRRLVPYSLGVHLSAGTFFVSGNQSVQNMVATQSQRLRLATDNWDNISVAAACANRTKAIPSYKDTFTTMRSPPQDDLIRVIQVLDSAKVDSKTAQAAVWIVTDNANYEDLGVLEGSNNVVYNGAKVVWRVIGQKQAAHALKICAEAGIDIKQKRIWADKATVLKGLDDGELKDWLKAQ